MEPTLEMNSTLVETCLAVGLELSKGSWKLALHDGKREKPALYTAADDGAQARLEHTLALVESVRNKWRLDNSTTVVFVYEAGQDGFWIARELEKHGVRCLMVDAASIPVERRARRAKTDRLDAIRLVNSLRGWLRGERDRMHVIRIPSVEAEGYRHLTRDRGTLQKEIGQHRDRLRKLLCTVGCWEAIDREFPQRLEQGQIRTHDGSPLQAELQERLKRECVRLALVQEELAELERGLVHQLPASEQQKIAQLSRLNGIGEIGAFRLVLELFWRDFANQRQVGACVGLVPQPYDSGNSRVDQGISKQGNRRVRSLLIEMAWMWLRYQPQSALACWFAQRSSGGNKRQRRIAIVAVARRLAIALWRYLVDGVIPDGAGLKAKR